MKPDKIERLRRRVAEAQSELSGVAVAYDEAQCELNAAGYGPGSAVEGIRGLREEISELTAERQRLRWLLRDAEPYVQRSRLRGYKVLAARIRDEIDGK